MTERDLSTLVRDHVTSNEPPFALSPDTAIGGGRRVVRRRRAIAGIACAAIVTTGAVVAAPMLADDRADSGKAIDPATQEALDNYDPQEMAKLLKERTDGVLDSSYPDHPEGKVWVGDGDGVQLPVEHWDKASGMSVSYGAVRADHSFSVNLLHSGAEAEGDANRVCADDLEEGIYLVCEVDTTAGGDVVVTRVGAKRWAGDIWYSVTRDQIDDVNPENLWFDRTVKSVHSETFLTTARENVKAADLETAESLFQVPVSDLIDLATDPALVVPPPPMGDNGCPWMLHPEDKTCMSGPDAE